jgi:hypothetical protein
MASKRKVLTLDERIKVIELCKTKRELVVVEKSWSGRLECILAVVGRVMQVVVESS